MRNGREALLEAALELLLERGAGEASARDIGARAGVPVSLINYHYGGKEALLREVTIEASRRWLAPVMASLEHPPLGSDPCAVVVGGFEEFLDSLPSSASQAGSFLEAVAACRRDPALAAALTEHYEGLRSAIARSLVAAGLPAPGAPAVASDLMAIADGWMVQWLMDGRRPSRARVRELSARVVGVAPRPLAAPLAD